MRNSAIISPCGQYRYRLDRHASPDVSETVVIMVNPSTADATTDDATIRKSRGFSSRYGWGNLTVGNLFAYRSTDVRELAKIEDPVGPDNDRYLRDMIGHARRVIFAWGPPAKLPKRLQDRWAAVYEIARYYNVRPQCLGEPSKSGHPCHPLMLPYEKAPRLWMPPMPVQPVKPVLA